MERQEPFSSEKNQKNKNKNKFGGERDGCFRPLFLPVVASFSKQEQHSFLWRQGAVRLETQQKLVNFGTATVDIE